MIEELFWKILIKLLRVKKKSYSYVTFIKGDLYVVSLEFRDPDELQRWVDAVGPLEGPRA